MLTISGNWFDALSTFISFIITLIVIVFITQIIWNNTMPKVFNLPSVGWWETLGLIILSNIFFGSRIGCANS